MIRASDVHGFAKNELREYNLGHWISWNYFVELCGSMSPGTFSGCGWRRQPPDVDGNCECIE